LGGERLRLSSPTVRSMRFRNCLGMIWSVSTSGRSITATRPVVRTPGEVARAQRQLTVLQWAVPALTGALVVITGGERIEAGGRDFDVRSRLGVVVVPRRIRTRQAVEQRQGPRATPAPVRRTVRSSSRPSARSAGAPW